MEIISTSTINTIDLINFSKDIAQLNLGYLGISVAILGVLGGVFVYFNIKPLKDTLDRQESTINDLKKEAHDLLSESGMQTQRILEEFKADELSSLTSSIKQQKENINLEVTNKIQGVESSLLEKTDSVSDEKDTKLKEIILSEVTNRLSVLEKNLNSTITTSKIESNEKILQQEQVISVIKSSVKDAERDIKELKVYKYSKENQMGAIIYSIDLLKEDINEKRWSIINSLERLKGEIEGRILDQEYISRIEEQLARLENEPKYAVITTGIRKIYSEVSSG